MASVRKRVLISGRVQGVNFRAYTRRAARQTDVYGWVRNLPDGRVEAVFEGDEEKVKSMLAWCQKGSPYGKVDDVVVLSEPATGEFTDFEIRYSGSFW